MEEMALGIWKRMRDPGFSPVSALQQPNPMWKRLAREFGDVISFETLQKGQGMRRMDFRAKR